ncbi:MAG TPA: CpsB/CapC family capsule biosynthesis tyrosine phosphatase [Solirubrobacteraceae bacterium]|nr:CpsB/CapC family capsule biosynthesis tyrosine phosphatase [Solirubrobacteraceae bacterium]
MIDLHCHVLPGIDDGPDDLDGSLAFAREAVANGIEKIVATPHVSWRYENDSATIAGGVERLRAELAAHDIELELLAGAEVALTRAPELAAAERSALRLGDSPWLLLEPPFSSVVLGLEEMVGELEDEGHRVLLAHPERCVAFHRDTRTLETLVNGGALVSVTADSLVGRFGEQVRSFALELLEAEMVHNVASDAHDLNKRRPSIAAELERAGLAPLREWLTEAVPAAMLAGEARIPPRPPFAIAPAQRSRRSWWRRGPLRPAS